MTNIKSTFTLTFTSTSPFNPSTYGSRDLEQAVEMEENIHTEDILDILREGSYRDLNVDVKVETLD